MKYLRTGGAHGANGSDGTRPQRRPQRRRLRRACGIALVVAVTGLGACRLFSGPSPEQILAAIETPPAPVLSAADELETFRLAPGFRIELVAAEPLVVDPVAMDWDEQGRLYVVEMRGYMPDVEGRGEERASGRVVVLEDTDADGRMDRSGVFLDELVLPRAIAVLPEGVLIGAPPDLLLCRHSSASPSQGLPRCEQPMRLANYATEAGNVEHRENRLLPGIDGWIYNSKSARRFQLKGDRVEIASTVFRGQWGMAQDDEGRLFYNHNSGFLYGDSFPAEYTLRQPAVAARIAKPGINIDLAQGELVHGVRVAPGLNRAYQAGTLRPDGRQKGPTAVSGLTIQRGHQFGREYAGHAFVPESAGSAVAHFALEFEGGTLRAEHRSTPDPDYGEREFVASTDERFRPVDARIGPDGALWLIDMYRGVIQHATYVSDYLREYIERQGLEAPGATGRIWRIVREDRALEYAPPSLATLDEQLAALDHPNGWVRDRAQRRLVVDGREEALPALRALEERTPLGRIHSLWALHALGALDLATWERALADSEPAVVRSALRVGEALLPGEAQRVRARVIERLEAADPAVRLQALHTLGALPIEARPLELLLRMGRDGDAVTRQAALSGLAGIERRALERELASEPKNLEWLAELVSVAYLAEREPEAQARSAAWLFERIAAAPEARHSLTLVEGIQAAQRLPGSERRVLPEPHPVFELAKERTPLGRGLAVVRLGVTWPGDPSPGGARALTPEETRLRERGEALFAETCATCHGNHGRGNAGLAPPLASSGWVRDADDWLVRIVLGGLAGPIQVAGEEWNRVMPGHGHDPRFDDASVAGLLTHLRRSWGHADEPVSVETVARIRAQTAGRQAPWSAAELLELDVAHRLDRYTGVYRIPIVGIEFVVVRGETGLMLGRREGGRVPLLELAGGSFVGEGLTIRFDPFAQGAIEEAEITSGTTTLTVKRIEDAPGS